ncbi:MAG: asparagine synthase (glutamine-hydrolyzing) [Muricauda sp.]|nr:MULTISPECIES: asparagine synthase (glutamine-hydrolyzing) [unclassified Allomuricauda]MAU15660.1 asparagine synthase (glutamine-hydrolyzing) [Allomuricauda sp.]|tara:strand:- start:2008 stop:3861 length:1854 start_codon:yes stop_codon:yes gene_type:complete
MCGILGTIPSSDHGLFKQALDTLSHRGPDSYGVEHISDEVSLGHRRLSILDISENGSQPMIHESQRYAIIFNGEIYNFLEIQKELEQLGHTFKSSSDTEVLLKSYIQWGEDCVLKFNGMWAFGIWDAEEKKLFLSRDRYGKKPLFYAFLKDKFVFASEMKAIFPFMDRLEVSEDFHWMKKNVFFYESTEKCLIKGIKRFPAGHSAHLEQGELKIYRYWNTLDHLVEVPKSYGEQVERFRELFMDSCKLRMRSDVTIGTALSGGLDSSATIAAMANLAKNNNSYSNDWQHAFVASFPGTPLDESHYAKMVTDHLGIGATFVDIDPLKHWDKLEDYFYLFEDLYITSPLPMIMLYGAVKENGTTVTLDGHGADELLSGYQQGTLESLWDARFNMKNTKDILDIYQGSINEDKVQYDRVGNWKLYRNYMIRKTAKKLLGKKMPSIDNGHPNFKKLDNLSQYLYAMFHENILPTLLRNYDRYAMINSVEIRMPFMDHRIVSFVNSLPYSSKIGNGYTKRIVRDALDPYLPKEVTWRKSKIGFSSPIVDWMQNDLSEWFLDTTNSSSFLQSDLVSNPDQLRERITAIVKKENHNFTEAQKCWTDLSPYIWGNAILNRGTVGV